MAYLPEESTWQEGIYQLDEDDDVVGGPLPEGISNLQPKQLADRTKYLKDSLETEVEEREELAETVEENAEDIGVIAQRVETLEGRGGPVDAHDFGSAAPTAEELTFYACENIWGAGGAWTWNEAEPWNSTYVLGGITHTASEIFSSTWVRNTFNDLYHDEALAQSKMEDRFGGGGTFAWNDDDPSQSTYIVSDETHYLIEIAVPYTLNHKWVLTNTPGTDPRVFSWQNVGQDTVAIANELLAGVVKSGGDIKVDPVTGLITVMKAVRAVPDYANQETTNRITSNGGSWTVQQNGFVRCQIGIQGGSSYVTINGKHACSDNIGGGIAKSSEWTLPVAAGDIISIVATSPQCYFIPEKWV
jgi:hypothetical protein